VHVAVARSSSGGVAIRYELPILWMTLFFDIIGQYQARRYVLKEFGSWKIL